MLLKLYTLMHEHMNLQKSEPENHINNALLLIVAHYMIQNIIFVQFVSLFGFSYITVNGYYVL